MMSYFSSWLRFSSLSLFLLNINRVSAECQSYGVDYVDGESYFINTESPDYFSFVTEFEGMANSRIPSQSFANSIVSFIIGCTAEDTVKPLVVDPNGDEYFCSDIKTVPNSEYQQSTW